MLMVNQFNEYIQSPTFVAWWRDLIIRHMNMQEGMTWIGEKQGWDTPLKVSNPLLIGLNGQAKTLT